MIFAENIKIQPKVHIPKPRKIKPSMPELLCDQIPQMPEPKAPHPDPKPHALYRNALMPDAHLRRSFWRRLRDRRRGCLLHKTQRKLNHPHRISKLRVSGMRQWDAIASHCYKPCMISATPSIQSPQDQPSRQIWPRP